MNILVIEDEKKAASLIKRGLEDDGYQVTHSHDGADGLKRLSSGVFDLVILDSMLPKKDGLTVLRELREAGNQIPVLMLSAKAETADIVTSLDAGADYYMTKPFAFAELQARVRSLLRRSKMNRGAEIRFADMKIDPVNHKVWRGQTEIDLTAKEYDVLAYFVRNAGTVISCANIADNCWDHSIETFSNIIAVYINYLRKKVDGKFSPRLIHTVRGKGYILKEGA